MNVTVELSLYIAYIAASLALMTLAYSTLVISKTLTHQRRKEQRRDWPKIESDPSPHTNI